MKAWGGISSLQLVLPLLWTYGQSKGITLNDLTNLLSRNTARLARLDHSKGSIAVGMDADFVIWNPDEEITVIKINEVFRMWRVNELESILLIVIGH